MKTMVVLLIIAFCIFLVKCTHDNNMNICKEFAKKLGCTIVSTDTHITPIGTPFYYVNKGSMIYEITLSNGEIWFMRPSIFGNDWEQNKK